MGKQHSERNHMKVESLLGRRFCTVQRTMPRVVSVADPVLLFGVMSAATAQTEFSSGPQAHESHFSRRSSVLRGQERSAPILWPPRRDDRARCLV